MYKVHLVIIKTIYPNRVSFDVHAYHSGGTFNTSYDLWVDYTEQESADMLQGFAEFYNLAILSEQSVTINLGV